MVQNNAPFFVLGTQRLGATLLHLFLNSHSDIVIPGRTRFLTPIFNKKLSSDKSTHAKLTNAINCFRALRNLSFGYDETELFNFRESVNKWQLPCTVAKTARYFS